MSCLHIKENMDIADVIWKNEKEQMNNNSLLSRVSVGDSNR